MKISGIWAVAALLAAAVGIHGSCLAGEAGAARPGDTLGALAGTAVSAAELNRHHARGSTNISIEKTINSDGSFNDGALRGNAVIGVTTTGTITTSNSINNNTGITTVFQNSGNNSLFQQSTMINITLR